MPEPAALDLDLWVHPLWPAGDWERLARDAVCAALAIAGHGEGAEIAIRLADDAELRQLNARFRGKDRPTDILSFPADPRMGPPGGDVALALETIATSAQARGIALETHTRHLIVHATLHLLGYTHDTDADARTMEQLERLALQRLGVPDPYEDDARPPKH